ncbi:YrbL family protein [Methylobrevis albus]|uniref:PhoP regulatory network protein YrbL n=1 Tax=Methylobrevis albus TaxID=2793297 RepID=A0A931I496_9HYPH|nr:YrbL family protein [Methylobrevis albus]MBH0238998.1 hypothetical protein [Methylobrevis albus]
MTILEFSSGDFQDGMGQTLSLTRQSPLAEGRSRLVYALSERPSLLLKVQKPEPPHRGFLSTWRVLASIRKYYKRIVPIRREIAEYRRVSDEGEATRRHLQQFEGLVQTSQGAGLVVAAVRTADGRLGQTLGQSISAGTYDARRHAALLEFLNWFVASKVVAADVHLNNIVYDETSGSMVLVDGIGDKTLIPLRSWSQRINRSNKQRLAKTIKANVALAFLNRQLGKNIVAIVLIGLGALVGVDMMDGRLIDG